jgi:peptide/nickel transport system substrate-binding protein
MRFAAGLLFFAVAFGCLANGAFSAERPYTESFAKKKPSGEPKRGGTMLVGQRADPVTLNPDGKTDDSFWPMAQNVFNRLLKLNNKQEVLPDLAKEYKVSEDGKEITFFLHENVKWHDGTPFTADDVKYTFEAIKENKGNASSRLAAIEEITCPNKTTVILKLSEPNTAILGTIAWYGTFILPRHVYENTDWTQNSTTTPIGTGPFKFEAWEKGVSVTLVRNEDYFGHVPYLDKVIFSIIPDETTAVQAMYNGDIDVLGVNAPLSEASRYESDPNISYARVMFPTRYYLCPNFERPPFDNPDLRMALALALDQDAIVEKALKGVGQKSRYFMTPMYDWAINKEAVMPERNIEKAKKIMEQAGLKPDKNGVYLKVRFDYFSSSPFPDIAIVVKDSLKDAGIDLTLNMMEYAAWGNIVRIGTERNFSLTMLGGYQGPDPNGVAGRVASNGLTNYAGYKNPEVDNLLEEAVRLVTREDRGAKYREVQKIMAKDLPLIPMSEWVSYIPYRSYVMGHPASSEAIDKTGFSEYTYCWLDN